MNFRNVDLFPAVTHKYASGEQINISESHNRPATDSERLRSLIG
jgi:hypothetical protein